MALATRRCDQFASPGQLNPFDSFSAECLYFGTALTDLAGSEAVPIGLIQSAVGGSMIESWVVRHFPAQFPPF